MKPVAPVLVAVILALAGCGGDAPLEPPNAEPPAYSGQIVDVAEGRILVRAENDACGIWLAPADGANVLRASGDGYARAAWDELEPGSEADVWIFGPIAESCPMQADANALVVRDA